MLDEDVTPLAGTTKSKWQKSPTARMLASDYK